MNFILTFANLPTTFAIFWVILLLHLYPELIDTKERVDMGIDSFAAELVG